MKNMTATEVDARVVEHAKKFGGLKAETLIMDDYVKNVPGSAAWYKDMMRFKVLALPASTHVIKGGFDLKVHPPKGSEVNESPLVQALRRKGYSSAAAAVYNELQEAYERGWKNAMDERITISPTPTPAPLKCEYNLTARVFQFNDGTTVPEEVAHDKRMLEAMRLSKAHINMLTFAHKAIHKSPPVVCLPC